MYQQLWGYKVEDKLYLGVREQKRLNTTDIDHKKSTGKMTKAIKMGPVIQALQLKALFVGGAIWQQKKVSHILCECVALHEFIFRLLGKLFMEQSDYDDIQLCKILYLVRGTGLLAE
jgi:hypothetical protein